MHSFPVIWKRSFGPYGISCNKIRQLSKLMTCSKIRYDATFRNLRFASSTVSVDELIGNTADKSLQRSGEEIHLTKCEDEVVMGNAYKYCGRCLGGSWEKCSPEKLTVQYISGGMTNYLYKCSLPDDMVLEEHEEREVVMRIYGDIVDLKQRFYESIIFTVLSERNIGPKIHGTFYSGRIEEFIPHRTVITEELSQSNISQSIARHVAEYHCMKLPLNKQPLFLWENCEKYIAMIYTISFDADEAKGKMFKEIMDDFDFYKEYEWMRDMLLKVKSPVVFCHNDVHEGNIMYEPLDGDDFELKLIDYDYSSYNYRGFDIANHFNEFIYTYTNEVDDGFITVQQNYPTRAKQLIFAEAYKNKVDEVREQLLSGELDSSKYAIGDDPVLVEDILYEANRFILASCFYWSIWSIVQAKISKIKMNYLKHTADRIETYRRIKKEIGY